MEQEKGTTLLILWRCLFNCYHVMLSQMRHTRTCTRTQFLSVYIFQIHSQNFGQPGAIIEQTEPTWLGSKLFKYTTKTLITTTSAPTFLNIPLIPPKREDHKTKVMPYYYQGSFMMNTHLQHNFITKTDFCSIRMRKYSSHRILLFIKPQWNFQHCVAPTFKTMLILYTNILVLQLQLGHSYDFISFCAYRKLRFIEDFDQVPFLR